MQLSFVKKMAEFESSWITHCAVLRARNGHFHKKAMPDGWAGAS